MPVISHDGPPPAATPVCSSAAPLLALAAPTPPYP